MPVVSPSCYELLGVPVRAEEREVGRAWRDRRAEALHRQADLDSDEILALSARLDEAFSILSDPIRSRHYRLYQSQLRSGRKIVHPEDFALLAPDSRATEPGVLASLPELEAMASPYGDADEDEDAVQTLDEWDTEAPEEESLDAERTARAALGEGPVLSTPRLGLMADVVLAVPLPGSPGSARSGADRRPAEAPWLALDAPDPEQMQPPVHAPPASRPGVSAALPSSSSSTVKRPPERPPWQK